MQLQTISNMYLSVEPLGMIKGPVHSFPAGKESISAKASDIAVS